MMIITSSIIWKMKDLFVHSLKFLRFPFINVFSYLIFVPFALVRFFFWLLSFNFNCMFFSCDCFCTMEILFPFGFLIHFVNFWFSSFSFLSFVSLPLFLHILFPFTLLNSHFINSLKTSLILFSIPISSRFVLLVLNYIKNTFLYSFFFYKSSFYSIQSYMILARFFLLHFSYNLPFLFF